MNLGEFIEALEQIPSSSEVVFRGDDLIELFTYEFGSDKLPDPAIVYAYPKQKVYYNSDDKHKLHDDTVYLNLTAHDY